jgi:hypothetical protein
MSPEPQTKIINTRKKAAEDDDDEKASASAKLAKNDDIHFQDNEIPGKGQPQVEETC